MAVTSEAFIDELTDFGDEPAEFYTDDGGHIPLPRIYPLQAVPVSQSDISFASALLFNMLTSSLQCTRPMHHDYCNDP